MDNIKTGTANNSYAFQKIESQKNPLEERGKHTTG